MKSKKVISLLCAASLVCLALAGCGSSTASSTESTAAASEETTAAAEEATAAAAEETTETTEVAEAAVAVEDVGGFEEQPIFNGAKLGDYDGGALLSMNGVYFQAVPMTGGYEDISDYDIHIEADISAEEGNVLGYGAGDWIPYLQVSYEITDAESGDTVVEGNFMPMSASDGPHYGANIALDPGTYDLTISILPEDSVYLIHTDAETGPGGGGHSFDDYFGDGALTYTYEDWEFLGLEQ